jgi:hypothetical protein
MKKWIAIAFLGLVLVVPARAMVFTGEAARLDGAPGWVMFRGVLRGADEIPANGSPGHGFVYVTMDLNLHTLRVQASFEGLLDSVTVAHIHCCTTATLPNVGEATHTPSLSGFPNGVTAGSYDMTFNTLHSSTWSPAFQTLNGGSAGAESAFFAGIMDGNAYFNIHTVLYDSGEIRANLLLFGVPEPATPALLLAGLAVVGVVTARRRRLLRGGWRPAPLGSCLSPRSASK